MDGDRTVKPALVIGGALVAVALIAGVVVLGGGGSGDDTSAGNPDVAVAPGLPDAAPSPAGPAAAPTAAPTGERAEAEFEVWAAPLRSVGLEVTAQSVVARDGQLVATGLAVNEPASAEGWRWTTTTAILRNASGISSFETSGVQTLALGDVELTLGGTISVTMERGADGAVTALSIEGTSLTLAQGEAPATQVGRLILRLAPDAAASGTTGEFRATDVVLPAGERTALGPEVEVIAAEFGFDRSGSPSSWIDIRGALSGTGGLRLGSIEIRWGVVDATGEGTLALGPDGQLAGTMSLAVPEPLTVLDAFHATEPFDRASLAQVYAVLLDELGPDPAAALPFTVDLDGPRLLLRGASRGVEDLVLGGIPPFLAPR